jgi:hypothetical protein
MGNVDRVQWNAMRVVIAGASACLLASCGGADLGQCDMNALATAGAPAGAPFAGQVVINTSCSGGRCHSATAKNAQRTGAPAGLNFDLVQAGATDDEKKKVDKGSVVVHDWTDSMWEEINEGEMPPSPPAGSGKLSAADKETVRNWMACGAPVNNAPAAAGSGTDWTSIFNDLNPNCVACHAPASAAAGGGFALGAMGDACGAYANIVGKPASGTSCAMSGMTLVVPSNPDGSLLIRKLTDPTPPCGSHMPLTSEMPLAATNPALVMRLRDWIMAGAMKPAECMP